MIKEVNYPDTFRKNIVNKLSNILGVDTNRDTTQMEKAIYEYANNECKSRNYVVNWNNRYFIDIYISIVISLIYI